MPISFFFDDRTRLPDSIPWPRIGNSFAGRLRFQTPARVIGRALLFRADLLLPDGARRALLLQGAPILWDGMWHIELPTAVVLEVAVRGFISKCRIHDTTTRTSGTERMSEV